MEEDEYYLVNVELEDRTNPNSKEMCCLVDCQGRISHNIEYKGNEDLNYAFDEMIRGEGNDIIVKIKDSLIVSWRLVY